MVLLQPLLIFIFSCIMGLSIRGLGAHHGLFFFTKTCIFNMSSVKLWVILIVKCMEWFLSGVSGQVPMGVERALYSAYWVGCGQCTAAIFRNLSHLICSTFLRGKSLSSPSAVLFCLVHCWHVCHSYLLLDMVFEGSLGVMLVLCHSASKFSISSNMFSSI